MKLKTMAAIAACGLAVASCGNSGSLKEIDLSEASQADSLGFFIGEQVATSRIRMQESDTILNSKEKQEAFNKGFEAGLKAFKEDNAAYNLGFLAAFSTMNNADGMQSQLGVKVTPGAILSGYNNMFDVNGKPIKSLDELSAKHQGLYNQLIRTLQDAKTKADAEKLKEETQKSSSKIPDLAKKQGFKPVNGVYVKVVKAGEGATLGKEDVVSCEVGLREADGKEVFPLNESRQDVKDVASYCPVLEKVIDTFQAGGEYEVMGTLTDILGSEQAANLVQVGRVKGDCIYVLQYNVKAVNPGRDALPQQHP